MGVFIEVTTSQGDITLNSDHIVGFQQHPGFTRVSLSTASQIDVDQSADWLADVLNRDG